MNAGLFCGSIGTLISKLNYQISSSPHLLSVIDGLLLRTLDMVILRVLCKQFIQHI